MPIYLATLYHKLRAIKNLPVADSRLKNSQMEADMLVWVGNLLVPASAVNDL